LINNRDLQKIEIVKQARINYTEQNTRLELQGLIAADPDLFQFLDRDQSPADSTASQLTDMFQTKILRGAPNGPYHIMLKTNQNTVSPLVRVNQSLAGQATASIQAGQQAQAHPQPSPSPSLSSKGSGKRGSPIVIGGSSPGQGSSSSQKKSKYQSITRQPPNNNNNSGGTQPKARFCAYCKSVFPKSKTCDTHYPNKCYRNPQSSLYDAAKAAIPPKN
jgi:hypothetical protein